MAGDVIAALDHAGVDRATIFGYSMGTMVAAEALVRYPGRFNAAVLGGMGASWPGRGDVSCRDDEPPGAPAPVRDLQRAPLAFTWWLAHYNPMAMKAVRAGMFRRPAPVPVARLGEIEVPVLVVTGTRDRFCPGTRMLAQRIRGARRVALPGQTHHSAVSDPRFRAAVRAFLDELPPAGERSATAGQA
jgi:pimeloyl-ACP methyl ester carboxylesterase